MPILHVEEGPNRGTWFQLPEGEAVLGREAGATVPLLDPGASRRHARVTVEGDVARVEDLGSRHGTSVDGVPVDGPTRLDPGARIRLGGTVLRFERSTAALGSGVASPTVTVSTDPGTPPPPPDPVDRARAILELLAGGDLLAGSSDPLHGIGAFLRRALEASGDRAARIVADETAGGRVLTEAGPGPGFPDEDPDRSLPLRRAGEPAGHLEILEATGSDGEALDVWPAVAVLLAPTVVDLLGEPGPPGRSPAGDLPEIVAESPAMREALDLCRTVAPRDTSVLITGESGTGKEVCARLIHRRSSRRTGPFEAVNAGAIPGKLVESELFGHERGAFSGAVARRKGLFELADGGTLFLDEVGELAPGAQASLLRVLESGELRPVGGSETMRVDVRLLAATNRDLAARVEDGTFREDLYHRIRVVEVRLPPLRDRPEDLEPLVEVLLRDLAGRRTGELPAVPPDTLDRLRAHPFPGNVRELRNVLERALIVGDGETIRAADLPPEVRAEGDGSGGGTGDEGFPTLEEVELAHVRRALARTGGVKTRAADLLGIDRKTLHRRVERHGLTGPWDEGKEEAS